MKIRYKILLAGCLCTALLGSLNAYADEPVLQPIEVSVPPLPAAENSAAGGSGNTSVQAIPAAEGQQPVLTPDQSLTAQPDTSVQAKQGGQVQSGQTDAQERLSVTAEGQSPYANVAVSQVTDYVNVRQNPNTGSAVVGKIYNNCAATIEETVSGEGGSWYRISSGSVNGYIKSQYFVTGGEAEELARKIGREFITISTEGLRLREQPDLNSNVLTHLSNGSRYLVQDSEGDFYKVEVDADLVGYVAKQYCKETVEFDQAVSLAEEQQKKAEESQRKQDAINAIAALEVAMAEAGVSPSAALSGGTSDNTTAASDAAASSGKTQSGFIEASPIQSGDKVNTSAPEISGGNAAETNTISTGPGGSGASLTGVSSTVTSATRAAIVAYAKQFLGNPYVFGGTSLTNGTDCSGFVQGVYAHFGITTGRSSRDQAANGKNISVTAAQPGDLLFYSSGDYINHVAIYIGNGQIIHAASARTGIKISNYDYRTPCKAVTFLE